MYYKVIGHGHESKKILRVRYLSDDDIPMS